jgi:hypothetical protein
MRVIKPALWVPHLRNAIKTFVWMSTGKPKKTTNGDTKNQSTHHISVILFQCHFRTLINLAMTGFCTWMVGYPQLRKQFCINPLNAELNPICYLLALLEAHHFLRVSRIRVKSLTLRLLMSYIYIYIYIYMEHLFLMFLDHTWRSTVGRTPLDE